MEGEGGREREERASERASEREVERAREREVERASEREVERVRAKFNLYDTNGNGVLDLQVRVVLVTQVFLYQQSECALSSTSTDLRHELKSRVLALQEALGLVRDLWRDFNKNDLTIEDGLGLTLGVFLLAYVFI